MKTIINILLSGIAVFITAYIISGVHVDSFIIAVIVAVILAVVNGTIGLFLKILTFPLTLVTLGIFAIVINVAMVMLVAYIVPGFSVDGFIPSLIFAIILSLINIILGVEG